MLQKGEEDEFVEYEDVTELEDGKVKQLSPREDDRS